VSTGVAGLVKKNLEKHWKKNMGEMHLSVLPKVLKSSFFNEINLSDHPIGKNWK